MSLELRFYEQPHAKAEFQYWVTQPDWGLEDIVALSLSKDPRIVCSDKFVHGTRGTEFSTAYFTRLETVERHHSAGELDTRTRPSKVIEWAEEYDFSLPQELIELVRNLEERRMEKHKIFAAAPAAPMPPASTDEPAESPVNGQEAGSPKRDASKLANDDQLAISKRSKKDVDRRLLTRERETLQALLAAIAIAKYQYNSDDAKSKVPQLVVKLLKNHGLTISAQTIRNHLKDGAELLPKRRPGK